MRAPVRPETHSDTSFGCKNELECYWKPGVLRKDRFRPSQGRAQIMVKLLGRRQASRMAFGVASPFSGCTTQGRDHKVVPDDKTYLCVCLVHVHLPPKAEERTV